MNAMLTVRGNHQVPELAKRIERKLTFALDHLNHWLNRVDVTLDDVNGERGGEHDKHVRVMLSVRKSPPIVVEERGSNWDSVISMAVERAAYVLGKFGARRRSRR